MLKLLFRAELLSGLRFEREIVEMIFEEVEQVLSIQESTGYQRIYEKGQEEGLRKGLQEGRQEGLREAEERFRVRVAEILRKRFGPVSTHLTERLEQLNLKQLDQALANALEADTLQSFEATL